MTGQNLVWVPEITALRGILERDPTLVATAYRRIAEEIRVSTGEGIQPDFSFHQHGPCLYNHGYGAAFAGDCPRIATQVAGTGLAFPPEKITILSGLLLDGSQWMTRGTASDFGAEGREITRHGQNAGYLATAARYMLQLPTGREDEFRALASRASGQPAAPPLVGNRHFWRSDMMTHHRPGYYTSARMVSDRIVNTDAPCNDEGLKSHHLADGCNPVIRTGREYRDVFPVWDWQKIPGTTVEQKPELAGSPRRKGTRSFAGGVSDGTYGLAAFDLVVGSLSARKSWFFFDDEYVCLGAGITCESDRPVLTTLNQCSLEGDVWIAADSQPRKLDQGLHPPEHPSWVWHDEIAYVFLEPAAVHLRNDVARGSWREINHRYSADEVTRQVFTLWIDHGRGPQNDSYAYAVAPGIDRSGAEAFGASPPLEILANEVTLQAVRHEQLKLAAAAFYQPGALKIRPDLTVAVDMPCLTLIRRLPDRLVISVSNPENKQATVRVQVDGKWAGEGVELIDGPPRSRLTIELPTGPEAGSTVSRTLLRR
jgi:chondroitin AC lyase